MPAVAAFWGDGAHSGSLRVRLLERRARRQALDVLLDIGEPLLVIELHAPDTCVNV